MRLEDQFIQKWSEELFNSGKCTNSRIFKTNFIQEKYLLLTAPNIRKSITRFRCRNSKLPIVLGSSCGISRDRRKSNQIKIVSAPYVTADPLVMNIIIFSNVGTLRDTENINKLLLLHRPLTFEIHELLYHLTQFIIIRDNFGNGLN